MWSTDFDAMAKKTMLRQLISKWGIMSIELQTAFEQDTVIEEPSEYLETAQPTIAPVTDAPAEIPAEATQEDTHGEMSLDDL